MDSIKIDNILKKYNYNTKNKIKDFLISEIDDDNLEDTISFVKSSDSKKQNNFADELYCGNKYNGIFIEGNQYLFGSSNNQVNIIDYIGDENGIEEIYSKITLPLNDFIFIISHKKEILIRINQ